jgi:6-phosphofructokinase 1
LPGSELSIGADTALNNIVEAVDKIKQSAVATRRCFVVEVMGHWCGYLALLSGMATGAERVYMHEKGVTLQDLQVDVNSLIKGFEIGRRLGLIIRNEYANQVYTTDFTCALFEEEGHDLFDVRSAILGHQQQGGNPSPFDRIQATRFGRLCLEFLIDEIGKGSTRSAFIGSQKGEINYHDMRDFPRLVDMEHERPLEQWWLNFQKMNRLMAQTGPNET